MIALLFAVVAVSDCDAAARLSGLDYRQCLGRVDKWADAEMVQQWRITLVAMRARDADAHREHANVADLAPELLASQRAWLRYREAECSLVGDQASGGTAVGELGAECSITLTAKRTDMLKRLVTSSVRYLR